MNKFRFDGSFVITLNELPYHVTENDSLYEDTLSDYTNNPNNYEAEETETMKYQNGQWADISETPEYIAEQNKKAKTSTYYKIISKYDQAIKNGVFKIDSEYYGNMSWYDTWTKAISLYESGLVLSDTFTVRLYKYPTSEDGVYYNYNTTQNLTSFKSMLQILNSRQFLLYQPIRNNLISQLKLATTIEEINIIEKLIDSSFGDIIDETTIIVQDGE